MTRSAPAPAAQEFTVSTRRLELTLSPPNGLLRVLDRRTGVVWRQYLPVRMAHGSGWGKVRTSAIAPTRFIRIEGADIRGTTIEARATWRGHPFNITLQIAPDDAELAVTIDTPHREKPLPWKPDWAGVMLMSYPYAFHHDEAGPDAVVPIDEGVIYSTRETDPQADPRRWKLWWLHLRLSMPWWGLTDGKRGVMTQIDTPYDCMFSIQWISTPRGERTVPQITWVASKQALAYPRRVTFRFISEGGYVAMAKAFRRAEQARGAFRSWHEKMRANPAVERLKGALDLWSQRPVTPQLIAALQVAGVRRAIIGKVGRGDPSPGEGIEPEAIKAADEAGFLIGRYHNYSWIQGRWVAKDHSLENLAVLPASGKLKYVKNAWDPKGRLDRCPAAHSDIFRKMGRLERELGINYFFTDCTTTGGSIHECYHHKHPLARSEGPARLNDALQELAILGLVVGSERGKWWATPTTHVFEGIETLIEYGGQYYGKGDATHWVGPYLKDKPGFQELCLGYDFNPARRLPLFQLVYHDSVYCTRRWNQDPGRDAALWNRHDLMNILYGTPPLIFMHPKAGNVIGGPGWDKVKDRYLQTYHNVCGWHEKIGFDEMTNHCFLSADRLVQETCFSSGRTVVVNFSDETWQDPRGFLVRPYDYHLFRK